MPKRVTKSSIWLFADNTTIATTCKNNSIDENFYRELKLIENWCTNNRLNIIIDKMQVSNFGRSSKESEIFLVNQKLNAVNSFKYLEVVVDNKLGFEQHIDHVCKKLAKFNEILYKAREVFSRSFLLRFYQVYAKLLKSYSILLFGCASKTKLNKILLKQKRILRAVFFKRKLDHITENFSDYNIHTVFDVFLDTAFKEYFYQILGELQLQILNFNQLNNCRQTHARSLRMLRSKSVRSNCLLQSVNIKVLKFYNFFSANSLFPEILKNMLKSQLISKNKRNFVPDHFELLHLIFGK